MKTKDMEISHVTQNEYVEKINLGGFFESFVTALCYFTLKKKSPRYTSCVEMICVWKS